MSGVNAVLGAGQLTAVTEPGTINGVIGPSAPLLPDPLTQLSMMSDPGAMVAALMVKTGQAESDSSRQAEESQEKVQDQEEQAQVSAMHQKASEMRTDALASGLLGVASGAVSLAGAAYGMNSAQQRASDAVGKLFATGRDVVSQLGKASEEDADGNIATHEHNASHASRAASQDYDDVRDAKKLIDSAVDFYREYSSTLEQSKLAATHGS